MIGLPPVMNFGAPEIKKKVVPEVLSGKKFICLAVSFVFDFSDTRVSSVFFFFADFGGTCGKRCVWLADYGN